jgi:formate/nitrite transporter FocA (FNT family)
VSQTRATKKDGEAKEHKAEEITLPEGELVYRAIRNDGDFALAQSSVDLAWSGLAAGISMGFSLAGEGLLRAYLPDARWTPLVAKFGYALGFLMVILGRQQLFTEQTLTAILPLLSKDRPEGIVRNVARMWAVVLAANLLGTAAFAGVSAWTPAFSPEVRQAFADIGREAFAAGFGATFVRAVYAGFLIAMMVWLLPGAGASRLWIVVLIAYIVGLGRFAHIIAGSSDCLYLVFTGHRAFPEYVLTFLVPTFAGNTIGGVGLVATLAHAQHAPMESR